MLGLFYCAYCVLDQKQKAAFLLMEANKWQHEISANDPISLRISLGENPCCLLKGHSCPVSDEALSKMK